jgi:hypothetical protein
VDPPIFIVGANRSGTTLVRLILNAHSRIAIPDELIYFDSYLASVPIEAWRAPDLSEATYSAFVEDFLDRASASLPGLDPAVLTSRILEGAPNFKRPYQLVLDAWARHHGKPRWGEKTPGNLFYADILYDMFPKARFIYVVRDPRAGVASMQRVSFLPDDVVFNVLSRRKHDTTGRATLERHVPAPRRMTVRYEDLVRDPAAVVRTLCDFIGEDFEPSMLHFHRDADDYMKAEAARDYNAAATAPISASKIAAWKDRLTTDEVAIVEHLCRDVMRRFGYRAVTPGPRPADRVQMAIKTLYWRVQCWRHRDLRHYTVKHPMLARTRHRIRRLLRIAPGT